MGVRSGVARHPETIAASAGEADRAAPSPSRGAPSGSAASWRETPTPPAVAPWPARPDASNRPKLLVVEDDPNIVELLAASLRFAGFDVSAVTNGAEAVAEARRSHPDLVVLDVMLPDLDGFEVIRRIRDSGLRTPVVFLTARDATEDKVRGLTLGGDDYVTKPFSLEELTARIRAVLRRTSGERSESSVLRFADLELDEESHEVRRGGRLVSLSPTEFKLLRYLMLNAGRVLSKAQILDHVWQYDFRGDDSIVESYISYLRRKVDTVEPRLIHTVRGVGYVLRLPS
jgi:two-component system OmpR family response regulator